MGGRGITVCDTWLDFRCFYKDMGDPPTKDHTLERIDNEKGYEAENCKWSTMKEQQRNKRNNILITFNDLTLCLQDWANKLNIPAKTIGDRYHKGWPVEKVLSTEKHYNPWNKTSK